MTKDNNDVYILAIESSCDETAAAVVKNGNVYGMQFHPEKSGSKGLALLKAFSEI